MNNPQQRTSQRARRHREQQERRAIINTLKKASARWPLVADLSPEDRELHERIQEALRYLQPPVHTPDVLIGQFFLSYNTNGEVEYQGQILARVDEHYLCQLYDWLVGAPGKKIFLSVADITGCTLFDTAEQWRAAYDTYAAGKR